jgi:hypothetical protein
MTKTLNHFIFFPPPKSEYFLSNNGNQNIFCFVFVFVLLTIVGTIYILSSAVILQCLKDFFQEDSQKNNLFFLEPFILKTPKSSISVADVMTQIMS